MRQKFVVRVLDAEHALLAWATVWALAKPLGGGRSCQFWPEAPTQFVVERAGTTAIITVHWVDYDLARMSLLPPTSLAVSQLLDFTWFEPVWLVPGSAEVPLPAVTVRESVTISVPSGSVSAAATN